MYFVSTGVLCIYGVLCKFSFYGYIMCITYLIVQFLYHVTMGELCLFCVCGCIIYIIYLWVYCVFCVWVYNVHISVLCMYEHIVYFVYIGVGYN